VTHRCKKATFSVIWRPRLQGHIFERTSDLIQITRHHLSNDEPIVIASCRVELSEQSAYVLVEFFLTSVVNIILLSDDGNRDNPRNIGVIWVDTDARRRF
jgi:hypothetical protein